MWLFLFKFHCPRSLKMGDIVLRTAQRFGVRKAICRGAALLHSLGDFALVGQVCHHQGPASNLPCHVRSILPLRDSRWRNWGKIVQAMRIVWFITCMFLEICLWASWSEFTNVQKGSFLHSFIYSPPSSNQKSLIQKSAHISKPTIAGRRAQIYPKASSNAIAE